jgi:ketosteroid isomerase-like protein
MGTEHPQTEAFIMSSRPESEAFASFMARRENAAAAYVCGDPGPVEALSARTGTATFFHPRGDVVQGAEEVLRRYVQEAGSFGSGGKGHLEVLQSGADENLAFWSGYQVAEVRMRGRDEPLRMRLRVTEVFRRIDGSWRLIHRHADPVGTGA